ncbi:MULTISPECIES: hypothetical protein [unclassified Novosphingobium]|uniref:hypothetical protein n=1 Tax=unclassified Novosphingobium TaxID=2644732 RepID=UPI00135B5C20|nr:MULTISPECIES: hypothetical protein [unclassified Novosphingobium]
MNMMAILALTAAASNFLPVQQKLDQIDRTFICPEDLPSDEARDAAMNLFVEQVRSLDPSATVANLVAYRYSLLVKHQCVKTLDIMKRN